MITLPPGAIEAYPWMKAQDFLVLIIKAVRDEQIALDPSNPVLDFEVVKNQETSHVQLSEGKNQLVNILIDDPENENESNFGTDVVVPFRIELFSASGDEGDERADELAIEQAHYLAVVVETAIKALPNFDDPSLPYGSMQRRGGLVRRLSKVAELDKSDKLYFGGALIQKYVFRYNYRDFSNLPPLKTVLVSVSGRDYEFNAATLVPNMYSLEDQTANGTYPTPSTNKLDRSPYIRESNFTLLMGRDSVMRVYDSNPLSIQVYAGASHTLHGGNAFKGDDNHYYTLAHINDPVSIHKSELPGFINANWTPYALAYPVWGGTLWITPTHYILVSGFRGVFAQTFQWAERSDPTVWYSSETTMLSGDGKVISVGHFGGCGAVLKVDGQLRGYVWGGLNATQSPIVHVCDDVSGTNFLDPSNWRRSLNNIPIYGGWHGVEIYGQDGAIYGGQDGPGAPLNQIMEFDASNPEAVQDNGNVAPFSKRYGTAYHLKNAAYYIDNETGAGFSLAKTEDVQGEAMEFNETFG